MKAQDPTALLRKLAHMTDALRWFLWLERHEGNILVCDGKWQVSARKIKGGWIMAEGKSLEEAMRGIESDLEEMKRVEARHRTFERIYGNKTKPAKA